MVGFLKLLIILILTIKNLKSPKMVGFLVENSKIINYIKINTFFLASKKQILRFGFFRPKACEK